VSGLRAFKTADQMTGARVCVLCNVKKGEHQNVDAIV